MKWFTVIVALLLALSGARAQGPDDQYIRIYNLIQEADKLNSERPAQRGAAEVSSKPRALCSSSKRATRIGTSK